MHIYIYIYNLPLRSDRTFMAVYKGWEYIKSIKYTRYAEIISNSNFRYIKAIYR